MQKKDAIERLKKYRNEILAYQVKSLALFGSVARDDARDDSDVDILVTFEGKATFDRYMDLKFFLEKILENKVDLITSKAIKPSIKPYIEREKINVT